MVKICLDFDTAVDFLRGEQSTIEKMRYYTAHEEICITSFTLLHLTEAVSKPEVVMAFANSVTVLPFDRRAAQQAARIRREIEEKGDAEKKMEVVLTAAICIANDAVLFSREQPGSRAPSKFDGIKDLKKV